MASVDDTVLPTSRPPHSFVDHTAEHHGRWIVLGPLAGEVDHRRWLCRCECGTERAVQYRDLVHGKSKSCGCFRQERFRINRPHTLAAHKGTSEYHAWVGAKQRCYYPGYIEYARYGGRGIAMAPEWHKDFFRFLADMGACPPGHQLDRYPDPDGPYAPGNCRWATRHDQMRNHSKNIVVDYEGKRWVLIDLAIALGLRYSPLYAYYKRRGVPLLQAIEICRQRQLFLSSGTMRKSRRSPPHQTIEPARRGVDTSSIPTCL